MLNKKELKQIKMELAEHIFSMVSDAMLYNDQFESATLSSYYKYSKRPVKKYVKNAQAHLLNIYTRQNMFRTAYLIMLNCSHEYSYDQELLELAEKYSYYKTLLEWYNNNKKRFKIIQKISRDYYYKTIRDKYNYK